MSSGRLTVKKLKELADSADEYTRGGAGQNSSTGNDTLHRLSCGRSDYVRSCVAKNVNADAKLLVVLATDKGEEVRYGVSINPNTNNETLVSLMFDTEKIRAGVGYNYVNMSEMVAKKFGKTVKIQPGR